MKIISDNSVCSAEFVKKMGEIWSKELDAAFFNEDYSLDESTLILCSLNGKYDLPRVDCEETSSFITKWVEICNTLVNKMNECPNAFVTVIINLERQNLINEFIAHTLKDSICSTKDNCSVNLIETNIELMLNSNYARMRFGYTERFSKPYIEKIERICGIVDNNVCKHNGVVFYLTV